jgi:hypothetical protein
MVNRRNNRRTQVQAVLQRERQEYAAQQRAVQQARQEQAVRNKRKPIAVSVLLLLVVL